MKVQTRCSWVGLSFDDGPDPSLTSEVLETLRDRGAKATFYVVGERVRDHPALVHQAANEGHSIGNHTWSHENLEDRPISAVLSELDATDTEIRRAGVEPVLEVRPPRGALAPEIGDAIRASGRRVVHWSIGPDQLLSDGHSAESAAAIAAGAAAPGSIILLHDGGPVGRRSVSVLAHLLDGLNERGLKVVPVDQLLTLVETGECDG